MLLAVLSSAHDIIKSDSDMALETEILATTLLSMSRIENKLSFPSFGTIDSDVDSIVAVAGMVHSFVMDELLVSVIPRCWSKDKARSSSMLGLSWAA